MALEIDHHIVPAQLQPGLERLWSIAAGKILDLTSTWDASQGSPVITVRGRYTSRAWTEWTEGFLCGCPLLVFDATNQEPFLTLGRRLALERMPPHLTHTGVHDHGFHTVSTFGNLLRLVREGRVEATPWEQQCYELAIRVSGAVQAARWSEAGGLGGFIHSFNGPQSLFVDTMRSLRVLGLAHQLGQVLLGENDRRISLLKRLVQHAETSARYLIAHGEHRDVYDVRGRTAHEAIFNVRDGAFRCLSSQQGYSPFTTWTRGLAWAMLGFSEQLEFLEQLPGSVFASECGRDKSSVVETFRRAARATCDHYIEHASCSDGVCYWDTGAPNLYKLGNYLERPAEPDNPHEPVDASAAAIAAQGLLRMSAVDGERGRHYLAAGLTVARTLLSESYLSARTDHQGLLLHSIYHRPNGWDAIPGGASVPSGESSMWGDYHLLELAVLIGRMAQPAGGWFTFFGPHRSRRD
jgi:hypothetical protein